MGSREVRVDEWCGGNKDAQSFPTSFIRSLPMSTTEPYDVLRLLQGHLEGRLRRGESRLWLQAEAAQALRELVRMELRPGLAAARGRVEEAEAGWRGGEAAKQTAEQPAAAEPAAEQAAAELGEAVFVVAAAEHPQRLALPEQVERTAEEKEAALAGLRERARRALGGRLVAGAGSAAASLVLVGDAPGAHEEEEGHPFAGPTGQLLDKIFMAMGLRRDEVYLTTVYPRRPAAEPGEDRAPTAEEMAQGMEFVREEIALVRPRVVVALGEWARHGLGGEAAERGQFVEWEGLPLMTTLHPAELREKEREGAAAANAAKAMLWQDLLRVMERAGLPISERQRGYFPAR